MAALTLATFAPVRATFVRELAEALDRIEAAHRDPDAFPKVSTLHLAILREFATNKEPVAISDLRATKRLVQSSTQTAISTLAGLLSLHQAPVRVARRRQYSKAIGRWVYHYYLARVS